MFLMKEISDSICHCISDCLIQFVHIHGGASCVTVIALLCCILTTVQKYGGSPLVSCHSSETKGEGWRGSLR